MSKYAFEIADESHESGLREILRQTEMPGSMSLSFRREPNFFTAEKAGNISSQVVTVRNTENNQLVGVGAISVRKVFVSGKLTEVGYLSSLRGLPEVQGGTLLARAYRFLKELHSKGSVPFYYTTILDENVWAKEMLTSGRCGLPTYEEQGTLVTHMFPLYKKYWQQKRDPHIHLVRVGDVPYLRTQVLESLNEFNREFDYAPALDIESLRNPEKIFPSFSTNNLFAIFRGNIVTATLGVWDQTSFKQSIVTAYNGPLRYTRPLVTLGSRFGLCPPLPKPGAGLPCLYSNFVSVKQGYEEDFSLLVSEVLRIFSKQGYYYLLAGSPKNSSLEKVFQGKEVLRLTSTLYRVYWEKEGLVLPKPHTPYVEIATL